MGSVNNTSIRAGAAIDIGTTTVQAQLLNLDTGETLETLAALSDQRIFGADVMTRIHVTQNGKTKELFSAINNQIENMLLHFLKKHNLTAITQCAVSGNTTMLHLFCNIDPASMGTAPYVPIFLEEKQFSGKDLFLSADHITLLPGISAFVGADITAGLAYVDILKEKENTLFIDIGTNGEMAVWKADEKRLLCCSTAAGPCFEESEISCGLNASDFIKTIAEMKRAGVIDETGALEDDFRETGFTVKEGCIITQKDIRQFQLAKSAIYSGIRTICKTAKLKLENIKNVYIAGGLGYHLNLESAAEVRLIPKEFVNNQGSVKTNVCGNTSLLGAVKSLTDQTFLPLCREIVSNAEVTDLTNDRYFSAAFAANMTI